MTRQTKTLRCQSDATQVRPHASSQAPEPLFPLRDLPKYEVLQAMALRFPELDPGAVEAYLMLLRVSTDVLAAMDVHLTRRGLSKGRFSILMLLLREEGAGLSPSTLAERSGVTRATVTGLLDILERDGFVRRQETPDDRRSHTIYLTSRGERFLREMLPPHFRRVATLMAKLSADERGVLVRLLAKINDALPFIRER